MAVCEASSVASHVGGEGVGCLQELLSDDLSSLLVGDQTFLKISNSESINFTLGISVVERGVLLEVVEFRPSIFVPGLSIEIATCFEEALVLRSSGTLIDESSLVVSSEASSGCFLVAFFINGDTLGKFNCELSELLVGLAEVDVLGGFESGIGVDETLSILNIVSFLESSDLLSSSLELVNSGFNFLGVNIDFWELDVRSGRESSESGESKGEFHF